MVKEFLLLTLLYLSIFGGTYGQTPPCVQEVTGLEVTASDTEMVMVRWTPVGAGNNVSYYRLTYRERSKSEEVSVRVELSTTDGSGGVVHTLTGLAAFTEYVFTVRVTCTSGELGVPSSETFNVPKAKPSSAVSNLQAMVSNTDDVAGYVLVNISWSSIPEIDWNAEPNGYFVYIFTLPNTKDFKVHFVLYPSSSLTLGLVKGSYGIQVYAVSSAGQSINSLSIQFDAGARMSGPSLGDYPYFYIIIPGVIFLTVIVVVTIVIFKKINENKKRSVTFVKDINLGRSTSNFNGFGNALPMRDISPQTPNTATSLPISSVASPIFATQPHMAHRPLPLSPASYPNIQTSPDEVFTTQQQQQQQVSVSRKNTHPGPLPLVDENLVARSRIMTNQSGGGPVFSPVSATSAPVSHIIQQISQQPPQQHHHQHHQQQQQQNGRGRSNTLPSPYEVPDINGEDVQQMRSNSAHPQRSAINNGGVSGIPPPPGHSPPPLTDSSMEMHSHMTEEHHHHHHFQQDHPFSPSSAGPVGQNTLPRVQTNQRSFSSSGVQGCSIGAAKGGMPYTSEGNIHANNDMVYIQPPLDSDPDNSIISSSSYDQGSDVPVQRGGRQHMFHPQQHHHPHHPQQQPHQRHPQQQQQAPRHPGMLNGALASSEQFMNFAPPDGPVPPSMPHYPPPPPGPPSGGERNPPYYSDDRNPSRGRESLFSETSTEFSISSGSEKDSTSGWDHRGAKSDVGVSHHRRQRSRSPPERETFSEVGSHAPQQPPPPPPPGSYNHQQNVFV